MIGFRRAAMERYRVLSSAIEVVGATILLAEISATNAASLRLLEKCEFSFEHAKGESE
jgi:hypothetical protein